MIDGFWGVCSACVFICSIHDYICDGCCLYVYLFVGMYTGGGPPSSLTGPPPTHTSSSYLKQGDNIITWTEPGQHGKEPYDMALSFQDEQGCREIWCVIFKNMYMYIMCWTHPTSPC